MANCEVGCQKVYTVEDWLFGCVNFEVPSDTVDYICSGRQVSRETFYADMTDDGEPNATLRLLKADLLKWIVLGPGKVNNTSDSDNGWSHSAGGYNISKDDKKLLMAEANAIYEELEPKSIFGKRYTKVHSLGIMPAMRDFDGEPIGRP